MFQIHKHAYARLPGRAEPKQEGLSLLVCCCTEGPRSSRMWDKLPSGQRQPRPAASPLCTVATHAASTMGPNSNSPPQLGGRAARRWDRLNAPVVRLPADRKRLPYKRIADSASHAIGSPLHAIPGSRWRARYMYAMPNGPNIIGSFI